jgi:hypothetical protein
MGFKFMESRSPSMASPAYQFSLKSAKQFKIIGGTHRRAGELTSLLSFLNGSRLKLHYVE